MSKKERKKIPNVSRTLVNFIILCKIVWRLMLFVVVSANFLYIVYILKSFLGIDLIVGWSLFH